MPMPAHALPGVERFAAGRSVGLPSLWPYAGNDLVEIAQSSWHGC